jgi:hypothetical protein
MKQLILILALAVMPLTMTTGCKTNTPQQIGFKSLASVQAATVVALEYYRVQFKAGKVTEAQRAQIATVYAQYQAAFALAATAAKMDFQQPATTELVNLANGLIQFIQLVK